MNTCEKCTQSTSGYCNEHKLDTFNDKQVRKHQELNQPRIRL